MVARLEWRLVVGAGALSLALGCASSPAPPTHTGGPVIEKNADGTNTGGMISSPAVPPKPLTPPDPGTRTDLAREIFLAGCDMYEEREYDLALIEFTRALDVDQNFYKAWYKKGLCYYQKRKWDLEIACYRRCVELQGNYLPGLQALANALLFKDDFLAAMPYFRRMLDIEPTHPVALLNLGLIYFDLENYEDSIKLHQLYLETYPHGSDRSKVEYHLRRAQERLSNRSSQRPK